MAISSWIPGIVEHVWTRLTGLERFVMFLYRHPAEMGRFLDKMVKFVIELGKSLVDAGVDVIWYGNDTAGKNGPIISPALHRKFIVPRLKSITDALKKKGAYVINHTYGNIYPILEDLVSTALFFGSPEEVAAEVKECIRAASPRGGYILASLNTLIKGFPVENIYTIYKTVHSTKIWTTSIKRGID